MQIKNMVTGKTEEAIDVIKRKINQKEFFCPKCSYVSKSDAEAYDHYMTDH